MESKKVFIGNLNFALTEEELSGRLNQYGKVVSIKLYQKKGYAFAEFETEADAENAVKNLEGKMLMEREIHISVALKPKKAKKLTVKKYTARGEVFEKNKKGFSKNREEGSAYPPKREWTHEKPSFSSKPSRDGEKPSYPGKTSYNKSAKPAYDYKSRDGKPGSDDRPKREHSGERKETSRPAKREWTREKPSFSSKPSRDGEKPSYGRSAKSGSNFKSKERTSGGSSSNSEVKKWASEKPAGTYKPRTSAGSTARKRIVPKKK